MPCHVDLSNNLPELAPVTRAVLPTKYDVSIGIKLNNVHTCQVSMFLLVARLLFSRRSNSKTTCQLETSRSLRGLNSTRTVRPQPSKVCSIVSLGAFDVRQGSGKTGTSNYANLTLTPQSRPLVDNLDRRMVPNGWISHSVDLATSQLLAPSGLPHPTAHITKQSKPGEEHAYGMLARDK